MNKKGESSIGNILKFAVPAFIVLVVFFGGLPTIINAFSFINKIPAVVWVFLGIILVFRVLGGKKR